MDESPSPSPNITKSESDEEDCESYFLQPASSYYNMNTKIEEANKALYEEDIAGNDKRCIVQFKEALIDYEPDLTDDDVQSIESYNELDNLIPVISTVEELTYVVSNTDLHDNIIDEEEICEEIDEEIDEDIEEINDINNTDDLEVPISPLSPLKLKSDPTSKDNTNTNNCNTYSKRSSETYRLPSSSRTKPCRYIDCKRHCIEALETHLELCVQKLKISEKPVCPTLKLQTRKCCTENCTKSDQKLPIYTGHRSEYGLTKQQFQRRERQMEVIREKQRKQQEMTEEYRRRKVEQNERIFCQWLRNTRQKRHAIEVERERKLKKNLVPTAYTMHAHAQYINDNSHPTVNRIRPNTSNSLPVSTRVKSRLSRRPATGCVGGPASVFIEIPSAELNNDFYLGNFLVRNVANHNLQQYHVTRS